MVNTEIRDRLVKHNKTFGWLINRLEAKGIRTDKSEMSSVMAGTRIGPKAEQIIRESEKILNEYDDFIRGQGSGAGDQRSEAGNE